MKHKIPKSLLLNNQQAGDRLTIYGIKLTGTHTMRIYTRRRAQKHWIVRLLATPHELRNCID